MWLRLALLIAATVSLQASEAAAATERPRVVACSTVVYDMLRHLGGDRIVVRCLLPPGVDPHDYQPVPGDAKELAQAQLVIVNGLGFEGWADKLLRETHFQGRVRVASLGVTVRTMPGDSKVPDPHAFNDLANGVIYAQNIRDALIDLDPADRDDFEAWGRIYIDRLRLLDGWVMRQVSLIPPERRYLVTDHDALQYFAARYGFTVLAPATAADEAPVGAAGLGHIVELMRQHHIAGVFHEPDKNAKLMTQLCEETGAHLGGELWLDGLGPPGTMADSYEGMFLANVRTIVRTLQ